MTAYDATTALVVVDVQNDFADPAGSLYVPGGEEVVDVANAEIDRAIAAGAPVVYTQDWHPPVTPHFAAHGGVWPQHCVRDTWGARLHPRLRVAGEVVRKGTGGEDGYSGFTMRHPTSGEEAPTGLADRLAAAGVTTVVVVGLAGDVCVRATALDARRSGWATRVLWPGVRCVELSPGDADRARAELVAAGVDVVDEPG